MKGYTELAVERREILSDLSEISEDTEQTGEITVRRIGVLSDQAADRIGRPKGTYVTLELPARLSKIETDPLAAVLTAEIRRLLPHTDGTVFAVGLGNPNVTVDALGALTAAHLLPTRHLIQRSLTSVAVIAPGVPAASGLETAERLAAIVKVLRPGAVLLIDALVSARPERVGRMIQITDTGILPGSGTRGRPTAVNTASLGVPTVALGVPMAASCDRDDAADFLLIPPDLDLLLEETAGLLGFAINCALQPSLKPSDIREMMP